MTFTRTTLAKLRALNLPQETVDQILEIFEEAHLSKPKKKGSAEDRRERGTRLPADWQLPPEWRDKAAAMGLHHLEVNREAVKFKNYWINAAGDRGLKLRWDLTWDNWCLSTLERTGRAPKALASSPTAKVEGPESFTDATWQAIAKRYKGGAAWNEAWGPPPGRMDCLMPVQYL